MRHGSIKQGFIKDLFAAFSNRGPAQTFPEVILPEEKGIDYKEKFIQHLEQENLFLREQLALKGIPDLTRQPSREKIDLDKIDGKASGFVPFVNARSLLEKKLRDMAQVAETEKTKEIING